jgi:hypothetical protein
MRRTSNQAIVELALCALLVSGCGGGADNSDGGGSPDLAMRPLPPDLSPPPRGPYPGGCPIGGPQEGDVICDISAQGFNLTPQQTDSSLLQYTTLKLDAIHSNPMCKCLLLTESAEWCGPCQAEQSVIVDYVSNHPDFCVFGVLIDGKTPGIRATMQDVVDWTQTFAQNFPVVGANIQTYIHLPRPDALPTNVVVDPVTMKILKIDTGIDPNNPNAFFDTARMLCAGM